MTSLRRRIYPQFLLALTALSLALTLVMAGCATDEPSPPPAPASPVQPALAPLPTLAPLPDLPTAVPLTPLPALPAPAPLPTLAPLPALAPLPTLAPLPALPTPLPLATRAPIPTLPVPPSSAPVQMSDRTLTVYSGRSQNLVHPILEAFGAWAAVDIQVKYAGSASTAATLLEEGSNTPADVVFLQDPGSLGSLAGDGMLADLPQGILDRVDPRFRDPNGQWIGTSGRARTIIYNTETIDPDTDLPASILDFTSEEWRGRVGWAPLNGSFQSFVTALRLQHGEDVARSWLQGMKDNDTQMFPNNTTIVLAASRGEVDVGFVNHYYLERFLAEQGPGFGARNYYIGNGDPGALVLVAGVGILKASDNKEIAAEFIEFLLSEPAQIYFTTDVKEYPVAAGVEPQGDLPSMESLNPPDVDLGAITDLRGTLNLLRDVGIIP